MVQATTEQLVAKFGATVNARVECVENSMAYISPFMGMENRLR